jgi:type IV pilus assembly protein PilZ
MNELGNYPTIDLAIDDLNVLYASYMPFLTHGGIFAPGTWPYRLGSEVMLHLSLFGNHTIRILTTVVWVTPQSAGARIRGIGLAFPDSAEGKNAKMAIEKQLGDLLQSTRPTYTI